MWILFAFACDELTLWLSKPKVMRSYGRARPKPKPSRKEARTASKRLRAPPGNALQSKCSRLWRRPRRGLIGSGQLQRSPEQRTPSARKGAQQAEMICPCDDLDLLRIAGRRPRLRHRPRLILKGLRLNRADRKQGPRPSGADTAKRGSRRGAFRRQPQLVVERRCEKRLKVVDAAQRHDCGDGELRTAPRRPIHQREFDGKMRARGMSADRRAARPQPPQSPEARRAQTR